MRPESSIAADLSPLPQTPSAAIDVQGLRFAYSDGEDVLTGVDLRIPRGRKVALLGASGAGKSTLLLHLNGIHLAQSGQVRIEEQPVQKENLRRVRERVGLVFQDPDDQLFHLTVEEDVAFGPRNFGLSEAEVRHRVHEALERTHLNGFEKRVNQHLSYGERRRVSIATVLSMRPGILALDEPFANLDPLMVKALIEYLRRFEGTVLLASQDILPALGCCDSVAILHQGKVAAYGDARQIVADRELLRRAELDFWYLRDILASLES
ncbi:MAG: energy-coupling factor ABC transporter ATP-binding protein [Bryobacterales bacterium]|nr:energy-coupling factor ABC transporter ATP-binding protein [Bryobacterales bacterium]